MQSLREKILSCLETYCDEDNQLVDKLGNIIAENGYYAYVEVFEVLTHLKLDPENAKLVWYSLLEHREYLRKRLGRDVGFRTSLCDYLCTVNKTLKNPIILENDVFENYLHSYMFDYLTGLYSRRFLETILDRELARCRRHETELSIIFFDIDNFKTVNDKYGHGVGDECLYSVANSINDSVRTEDTVVRYGGEEIVVIYPRTNKMQARNIGERIRKLVENTSFRGGENIFNITLSGGLVSYPLDGKDSAALMRKADQAMYLAKGMGKNNIFMYSNEKRRYARVNYDSNIEVKSVGFHDKSVVYCAQGRDISTGGVLFESNYFFDIGSKLQLKLPFRQSGAKVEVTGVAGVVVRNNLNMDGSYNTGISFLDVEKPAKNAINAYLETRLEQTELKMH